MSISLPINVITKLTAGLSTNVDGTTLESVALRAQGTVDPQKAPLGHAQISRYASMVSRENKPKGTYCLLPDQASKYLAQVLMTSEVVAPVAASSIEAPAGEARICDPIPCHHWSLTPIEKGVLRNLAAILSPRHGEGRRDVPREVSREVLINIVRAQCALDALVEQGHGPGSPRFQATLEQFGVGELIWAKQAEWDDRSEFDVARDVLTKRLPVALNLPVPSTWDAPPKKVGEVTIGLQYTRDGGEMGHASPNDYDHQEQTSNLRIPVRYDTEYRPTLLRFEVPVDHSFSILPLDEEGNVATAISTPKRNDVTRERYPFKEKVGESGVTTISAAQLNAGGYLVVVSRDRDGSSEQYGAEVVTSFILRGDVAATLRLRETRTQTIRAAYEWER